MKKTDHVAIFLSIVFCSSIFLSLFVGLSGGYESRFIWLRFFASVPVSIAVIIMTTAFSAPAQVLTWNEFPVRWLPLALFLMPLTIHAVGLPLLTYLNNGRLPWQSWLVSNAEGVHNTPANFGWGTLTSGALIARIFFNAVTGVIIVSLIAFLEEIGWRAWLLPRLIEKFDVKKGVLIGAAVWALWHVPFMLSGIIYIKGIPTYLLVLINPFGIMGSGIVISWFWLKTKSIWIVCIAHGALNNWGQYAFKYMEDTAIDLQSRQIWLFTGVNGSLLILGLIVLVSLKNNHTVQGFKAR